jgi:hypothetical protein
MPSSRPSPRCARSRSTGAPSRPSDLAPRQPRTPWPPGASRRGGRRRAGGPRVRNRRRPARGDAPRAPSGARAVRPGAPLRGCPRAGRARRPPRGLRLRVLSHRSGRRRDRRPPGGPAHLAGSRRRPPHRSALGWLARCYWYRGRNAEADAAARGALDILEALPPGRELAMAYSTQAGAPDAGARRRRRHSMEREGDRAR